MIVAINLISRQTVILIQVTMSRYIALFRSFILPSCPNQKNRNNIIAKMLYI